jgi:hypothetical protein
VIIGDLECTTDRVRGSFRPFGTSDIFASLHNGSSRGEAVVRDREVQRP